MKIPLSVRIGLFGFALLAMARIQTTALTLVTFSDDTFESGNWKVTTAFNSTASGESDAGTAQKASGGNMGGYRLTRLLFGHGELAVVQLNSSALFNPAAQGAIVSVDYSYDFLKIFPIGFGAIRYSLAMKQGDDFFVDQGEAPSDESWTTHAHKNLVAADFFEISPAALQGSKHPDFSPSGQPLQFGFLVANDDPAGPSESDSGIDNWIVQLQVKPLLPWLELAVSKIKVTEHVTPGKAYWLEVSADMKFWTTVGAKFTATSETVTQEFDVQTGGKFYRLTEVP